FFFQLAWWSYILVLAGLNESRHGNAVLLRGRGELFWLAGISVGAWLGFEVLNFKLGNWHYIGLPIEGFLRWPGYVVAFATVIPGVLETERFLDNQGVLEGLGGRRIKVPPSLHIRLMAIGLLMLIGPFLSPEVFFPFIWMGLVFLLDPILYRSSRSEYSILSQAESGSYELVGRLAIAGLLCGILWEFWNFWAGAKWFYTIPYFDFLKVFEMPVVGYLGFMFFALECYLLYQCSILIRERARRWNVLIRVLILAAGVGLGSVVVYWIDTITVMSFRILTH
ncbi:MAG: hypothetical protein JSU96_05180, partial [Acidobacteriota bacterium]